MTRSTPLRTLVVVLVLALIAAACGGDDSANEEGVATLQDDTTDSTLPVQRQDIEDAVLEFSQCMRDEGIDIPDIQLDADGAPILDAANLQDIDLQSPEFQSAFTSCISVITDAGAFAFDFDPEIEAIIQDQLQQFAECMRREGIEDFPDPIVGGSGTPFPLSAFSDLGDADFQAALESCQQESTFSGLDE